MIRPKHVNNRKRYLLLVVIAAGIGFGGYSLLKHLHKQPTAATASFVAPEPAASAANPPATPTAIALPQRLRIAAIGVDASIQYVGLTASGNMAAPTNATDVAWYKPGTWPGKPGNAVMAGHLDVAGKPAVFGNLNKLHSGDMVEVVDVNNHTRRFKVTSSQRFDIKTAPLQVIFGPSDQAHLNLITCDGAWDKNQRIYNQRLVVFTQAI